MGPELRAALQSWDLDHAVVWLLPLAMLVYTRGFWRVHVQMPQRYPAWRLASFGGGLAVVFLAVASPLDPLGELLLSLHMTQHMLLMMVAPPLIWLGQPFIPMLRSLPPRLSRHAFGWLLTSRVLRRAGRALTHPMVCWIALAVAIVVWHLPRFYELGLRSEGWHEVQHACFFTAALLFWWPVIAVWPSQAVWPRWTMIPYLVAADLINTVQSAVLSFSGHVLYPTYESAPRLLGLSALDDQTLAGVIMWVPGSIVFLLPAVLLTVRLFEPRSAIDRRRPSAFARQ
jgi:cytochrome c oxidase assembly factor CtaG